MMDDGVLSQEEINALLNVSNADSNSENEKDAEKDTTGNTYLTSMEKDALGEIGNISLGSSATTLSTILNQKVEITTPKVSIVRKTGLKEEFPYEHVKLQVNYLEGFDGENIFLMKAEDAAVISDIMMGGEGVDVKQELTEIELSAVQEAMNQMMGASATSMSTVFDKRVDISPPLVEYEDIDKLEEIEGKVDSDEEVFVKVSFQLKVGKIIDSSIMQIIPLPFAKQLVQQLLQTGEDEQVAATVQVEEPLHIPENQTKHEHHDHLAIERTIDEQPQQIGNVLDGESAVQEASFSEFDPVQINEQQQQNLDLLLDIPLKVTVELGRTKQTVEEVLGLTTGSVVELDKLAGEPVDVLVNNKLIAKGEVVVIDENFGVRVTDIVNQKERLLKLN